MVAVWTTWHNHYAIMTSSSHVAYVEDISLDVLHIPFKFLYFAYKLNVKWTPRGSGLMLVVRILNSLS